MRVQDGGQAGERRNSGFCFWDQLGWRGGNLGLKGRAEGVGAQREKLEGCWKGRRLRSAGFLFFNTSLSIFPIV